MFHGHLQMTIPAGVSETQASPSRRVLIPCDMLNRTKQQCAYREDALSPDPATYLLHASFLTSLISSASSRKVASGQV